MDSATTILGEKSRQLFRKACRFFPGGVNSPVRRFDPYPFSVIKGSGSRVYSVDEKEYIDYCMAYGALILGHAYTDVVEAVADQLSRGTMFGVPTKQEIELANLIARAFPSMEMVRFVNSGTEATMHAVRLARAFTGRPKIVKFEGAFHGSHDSVLTKRGPDNSTVASSEGIPATIVSNTIMVPYNDEVAIEELLEDHSHEIAAIIVEPVLANIGLILPRRNFLSGIVKLARRHGVLTVFDEVITGFRLAYGGAQEYYGVSVDLTTLSKAVGGGFPLACYGGKREIMEMVAPLGNVYQAGTYSGNPISVVAGIATLSKLKRERNSLYPQLERMAASIASSLRDLTSDCGLTVQVHQIASLFQLYFTQKRVYTYADALSTDPRLFKNMFMVLLRSGIFIPPSNFESCFLSTAHTNDDVERTMEGYSNAFRFLRKNVIG